MYKKPLVLRLLARVAKKVDILVAEYNLTPKQVAELTLLTTDKVTHRR